MIKFGISLLAVNNSSRPEVIVLCILFHVEHDKSNTPLSQLGAPFFEPASQWERADLEHNHDGSIPLALTLDWSVNIFNRARIDVLKAEILVRQLLTCKRTADSGANDVPPLVDVDDVCSTGGFCHVGVANILASYDATDKLKVESTNTCRP